jgi:hypothetical protein
VSRCQAEAILANGMGVSSEQVVRMAVSLVRDFPDARKASCRVVI